MAISTLSKLSVPLASDQSASSQGMLMPKLQYRFRVSFENFGVSSPTTELTKQVIDCTRPNITFEDIELPVYNSKVRLAGRHTWENISVNLRDDATSQVQRLVGEQLQKQFDFFEQASAASGSDYKFTTRIEILDGGNGAPGSESGPNILETWEVYGCYLQGANYNTLNYATSEPVTIALTIRYDNAIQTAVSSNAVGGVGLAIGRGVSGILATGGG
jgi:hypothetical protein